MSALGGRLMRLAEWRQSRAAWRGDRRARPPLRPEDETDAPENSGGWEQASLAASRAAAGLGVLVRVGPVGSALYRFPPGWSLDARRAFVAAVDRGASWRAALAEAAARGGVAPAPGGLSTVEAAGQAAQVEALGLAKLRAQQEPGGEEQAGFGLARRTYPWGVGRHRLPGGNPPGLEPRYLLARQVFGLSEDVSRSLAFGPVTSAAGAGAAKRAPAASLPRVVGIASPARPRPARAKGETVPRDAAYVFRPLPSLAAVGAGAGYAIAGGAAGAVVGAAAGAALGLVLGSSAAPSTTGAPDTPPHEGDAWITTDDARDYARWLNGKVEALNGEAARWMYDAATVRQANEWFRATDWSMWRAERWRPYFLDLEASWWARVDSWRDTKDFHREYEAKRAHAAALGLPLSSASAAPKPDEVTDQLGRQAGEWYEELKGGVASLGWWALGAGALFVALVAVRGD